MLRYVYVSDLNEPAKSHDKVNEKENTKCGKNVCF